MRYRCADRQDEIVDTQRNAAHVQSNTTQAYDVAWKWRHAARLDSAGPPVGMKGRLPTGRRPARGGLEDVGVELPMEEPRPAPLRRRRPWSPSRGFVCAVCFFCPAKSMPPWLVSLPRTESRMEGGGGGGGSQPGSQTGSQRAQRPAPAAGVLCVLGVLRRLRSPLEVLLAPVPVYSGAVLHLPPPPPSARWRIVLSVCPCIACLAGCAQSRMHGVRACVLYTCMHRRAD